jgi:2-C-methyl-D-erythritol 2,4-cyclodiphosphate synthase
LKAHSDGDVLIHALSDALLGASALGDIGRHFPDTDEAYLGADSRVLLRHIVELLEEKRYNIVNVDNTIVAQAPKLASHIEDMRNNLAHDLGINVDNINVKATTTEGLGFAGRKEGIEVHSVALIMN